MDDHWNPTYNRPKLHLKFTECNNSTQHYLFQSDHNKTYLDELIKTYTTIDKSNLNNFLLKKSRPAKFISDKETIIRDLQSLSLKASNFTQYVQGLFKIDFFNKFNTIHVFIHEKGKGMATHLEVTKHVLRSFKRSILDFNKLFNSIKKSKNRSFGQANLKGLNFKILGTFMGREISLPKYNIIFIISRDEFLPQDKSDIEIFNLITQLFPSDLNNFLTLDSNNIQIDNIKMALTNLNLPLRVTIGDYVIFNNIEKNYKPLKSILVGDMMVETAQNSNDTVDKADIYHKERVALLGELLNTLRHELSNPLFGLKLTTELLLTEDLNIEQHEFLSEISHSLDRCSSILENFSSLYGSDKQLVKIDTHALVDEAIKLTKSITRGIHKEVISTSQSITLRSNPTLILQVLFNLIINAAQELNKLNIKNPEIIIQIQKTDAFVSIQISDNGKGIHPDKIASIFKPFYTTKHKGTGLGLYISQGLAKKLSGTLEYIQNSDEVGAKFELKLPIETDNNENSNN